jgi:hypothetical protein
VGRCWTRARKAARAYSEAGKTKSSSDFFIAAANELGEQSDKRGAAGQRLEWKRHCSCEGQLLQASVSTARRDKGAHIHTGNGLRRMIEHV